MPKLAQCTRSRLATNDLHASTLLWTRRAGVPKTALQTAAGQLMGSRSPVKSPPLPLPLRPPPPAILMLRPLAFKRRFLFFISFILPLPEAAAALFARGEAAWSSAAAAGVALIFAFDLRRMRWSRGFFRAPSEWLPNSEGAAGAAGAAGVRASAPAVAAAAAAAASDSLPPSCSSPSLSPSSSPLRPVPKAVPYPAACSLQLLAAPSPLTVVAALPSRCTALPHGRELAPEAPTTGGLAPEARRALLVLASEAGQSARAVDLESTKVRSAVAARLSRGRRRPMVPMPVNRDLCTLH